MEWRGGNEGLTAINFAKIGAYAVAGRQSNPSSAHYPPYVEMGVQLDRRARSDALLVAIPAEVPAFCNYLAGTQNSFSFSSRYFLSFSPVGTRDIYRIRFSLEANDFK